MRTLTKFTCGLVLTIVIFVSAQGNKGGKDPVVPTGGADTIYYSVTNSIYSITESDPVDTSLVTKYTQFFLNRDIQYYCTYNYTNKVLSGVNFYDANNQKYAYGLYIKNSLNGFDYTHYASDGTLISKTIYDSNWVSKQLTVYTVGEKTLYKVTNTVLNGYITNELYYNEKDLLVGEGIWSFNPATQVTLYTYTKKDGSKLTHSVTGDEYDRYEIYYYNYQKDSLKLYNGEIGAGTLIYAVKYSYDANGYMTTDKYYKEGELKSSGYYAFDSITLKTTYTYQLTPDTVLWKTVSDYRGYNLQTEYYSKDKAVESIVTYEYDKYANYSKITKKNSAGKLVSYETYAYYDPYSILKEFAVYDSTDKKISYKMYDIYGTITSYSSIIKSRPLVPAGILNSTSFGNYNQNILFDIRGRVVGRNTGIQSAAGVYLNRTNINGKNVKIAR